MDSTHNTISDDVTGGTRAADNGLEGEDEYSSQEDHAYESEDNNGNFNSEERALGSDSGSEIETSPGAKIAGYDADGKDRKRKREAQNDPFPELDRSRRAYRVLHRVICSSSTHHIFKLFEDIPVRGSVGHLSGFEHLRYEEEYVNRYPDIGFLVIKEHYCKPEQAGKDSLAIATAGYSKASHHYSENGRIRIVGEELREIMDDASEAYIYGNDDNEIAPPYLWLYHHFNKLREGKACANSVQALLDYAEEKYGDLYSTADQLFSMGNVDRNTLPFLFKPNSLVLSQTAFTGAYATRSEARASVLRDWPTFEEDTISFDAWHYKHNSVHATRSSIFRNMKLPITRVSIRSMPIYPLDYASNFKRSDLISRGREYWTYRKMRNVCYTGWDHMEEILLNEARVIIDYSTYRQLHPHATYWHEDRVVREHDQWPMTLEHDRFLTEEYYVMFPDTLHAFVLKEKKWITVRIECISDITWNVKAFERLVLPELTKDLIKSLVLVRTSDFGEEKGLSLAGKRKDMIAGKGNGLIMLLHGAPGTGKTLTAESVAEIAQKPLYNVTCGDIGTNAEQVEKYLKSVLFLSKTWNCILLLDEADVFLEERSLSDLKRNSLVSVFLRTLEYYDGILILTSNRVGTFDEAFSSRIQVSLHFPLLDPPSRKKIWKNFFDMLREDQVEVDYTGLERRLDELSDIEMNGRQIRNILTTARQLAMYKRVTIGWEHLQRAIMSAADFTKYIQNVHGHTDEQNARDERLR